MNKFTLYNMNVMEALKRLPDESIDCCVTSPPYWALRDYGNDTNAIFGGDSKCVHEWEVKETNLGNNRNFLDEGGRKSNLPEIKNTSKNCIKCGAWEGKLGIEPTPEMYVNHLLLITKEIRRVLKPTGTLWWNINDTYASGGGKGTEQSFNREKNKATGQPDYPDKASLRNKYGKSKLLIPEQFAIKMVYEQDWLLRNTVIWQKPGGMPSSATDRLTSTYENVYLFVKKKSYYFNLDAIRSKTIYPSNNIREICEEISRKARNMRNQEQLAYSGKANNHMQLNFGKLQNYLVALRKIGKQVIKEHPELSGEGKEFINTFIQSKGGNANGSNPGDIWSISTESLDEDHTAAFPSKLVYRCLAAGCPPNGTVLDPFMGSGTTAKVALDMDLNVIGSEISKNYLPIIERRSRIRERVKLNTAEYEIKDLL